jgi:ppGpp synthetase/RelA/SpoT-type nucleotidyltranferase
VLADHPDVADVVAKLVQDQDQHPLNVNRDILYPLRRDRVLELIRELADGQVLRDRDLQTYLSECPGQGLVFEGIPDDVNVTEDGTSRKQAFVDESKELDPARAIGMDPTEEQQHLLDEYAAKLIEVEIEVTEELRAICPEGASFSVRSKDADAVLNKVMRMSQGSPGRPGRPNYRVGDVIDAVGGRITVENMDQLEQALRNVQQRFGTGDGGRILEIENMYAEPKSKNPEYRVIPMVVRIDVDGEAFTFELQLTTRRASVAADVEHNTLFKPYHELSDEQREHIKRMQSEAAALDQEETRQ